MKSIRKITASLLALAIMAMPFQASALQTVTIEGSTGVANVNTSDPASTVYPASASAKVDEVVKVQVYYHNTQAIQNGVVVKNVKVGINLPEGVKGKVQHIATTTSSDNSNTLTGAATVNLSLDLAYLEYVPGSATWKHNTGTSTAPNFVYTNVSDNIVKGGIVLGDEQPCNFGASVTVLARVRANVVSIVKQVRKSGEKTWSTSNTANQGDTLEYMLTIKNEGNTTLKHVAVGDNLPPHMTYVNGSTKLKNGLNPNGVVIKSDNITKGGIDIGDYAPGAVAYVLLQVKVDQLANSGCTDFKNVGVVRPEGMNEYFNVALTKVCKTTPPQNCTTNPERPECKPPVQNCTTNPERAECKTPPVTPPVTSLPETGAEAPLAGIAGMGGMSYAASAYLKSKKRLADALRNVRK